jgi:hypothetical protein
MKLKKPDTNKIKELSESVEKLTEQVHKINELVFQLIANNMFEAYPELKKFAFTGYVPGFNDGDECIFTLGTDYPQINEDESDDYSNDVNSQLSDIVTEYLNILPEDFYQSHFGSNFRVVATREGVTVEDYDCGF